MKTSEIAIGFALILVLTSCGISKNFPASEKIKDQKLSTDFTDEGVKIFYTFTGQLDRIEVNGQADAWKGNVEILAEADALSKLAKFIYGANITSERRVKIIARAIQDASDSRQEPLNENTITKNAKDLEFELNTNPSTSSQTQRTAKTIDATIIQTITLITAKGKLTGVRKIRDGQSNSGRVYVAVYQWSNQDQAISDSVKTRMQGN